MITRLFLPYLRLPSRQMHSFDAQDAQALALVPTGSCSFYENWKACSFPVALAYRLPIDYTAHNVD